MKQKTAIIYSRVSTNKQGQQGESLENQEKDCVNYCERNDIKVLCKPFREQFTGTKSDRPKFNEALSFINNFNDKVDYCIIYKIDRSTRGGLEIYNDIKKKLMKNGVILKDIQGIIQEERNILEIDGVNTDKYDWAKVNPGKYSEHLQVMFSEEERNQILQRMIGQQIRNAGKGYQVRQANFGFKNQTIISDEGKKKVIQIENPEESSYIKRIFELKIRGDLNDKQIVEKINLMGYKSRERNKWNNDKTKIMCKAGGNKLDVKTMQVYLSQVAYAGIKLEEWTGFKPIKAPYPGLIDINTFNKANKGKIKIIENINGELNILYGKELKSEHIKEKRLSYNSDYPYSKVLKCPTCLGYLTANKSRSGNGTYYYYYQCKGKNGIRHKNYKIDRDIANKGIIELINNIKPNIEIMNGFNEILDLIWNERQLEIRQYENIRKANILNLKHKQTAIISSLDNYLNYPKILEVKNKELENIEIEIKELTQDFENNKSTDEMKLDEFKTISNLVLTQLDKLATKRDKPEIIKLTFDLIFDETPTFEEIESHTIKMFPIFSLQAKKNPQLSGDLCKIFYGGAYQSGTDDLLRARQAL